MKYKVYINNLNYLQSHSIKDCEIPLEIDEVEYLKTRTCPIDKLWKWNNELNTFELVQTPILTDLRAIREELCFSVMNRGYLWYASLSEEQQKELLAWYHAWLDVTETGEIPDQPEWLN